MKELCINGQTTVKCVTDICCNSVFCVTVYDSKDCIVFSGTTDHRGSISFDICSEDEYRIKITGHNCSNPAISSRWVRLYPFKNCCIYFCFNFKMFSRHEISKDFTLTDYNYSNLPIPKGEIYLWENLM